MKPCGKDVKYSFDSGERGDKEQDGSQETPAPVRVLPPTCHHRPCPQFEALESLRSNGPAVMPFPSSAAGILPKVCLSSGEIPYFIRRAGLANMSSQP